MTAHGRAADQEFGLRVSKACATLWGHRWDDSDSQSEIAERYDRMAEVVRRVEAEEREACAKVAGREWACSCSAFRCENCAKNEAAAVIAAAIRARGETEKRA